MDQQGITLVEILTGLVIAAILATTATHTTRDLLDGWQLSSAVRQVVLDLRQARIRSITQARGQRLHFEPGASSYQLSAEQSRGQYEPTGPSTGLPPGISIASCSGRGENIAFRPRGNAAAFGTLTLQSTKGAARRIIVDIAGRVRTAQ